MSTAVVTVHGLWMNGLEMGLVRRRLRRQLGFPCHSFSYRSVAHDIDTNIARLRNCIEKVDADKVHVVAHSLGGVLTLHMLAREPLERVGRVVCLGSPLTGSNPARKLRAFTPTRRIIGPTLTFGSLDAPLEAAPPGYEVGVIAGTFPLGIGMLVARLERPHDGIVAVSETRLPGIADHHEVRFNHDSMLLSARVAELSAHFLLHGSFT